MFRIISHLLMKLYAAFGCALPRVSLIKCNSLYFIVSSKVLKGLNAYFSHFPQCSSERKICW